MARRQLRTQAAGSMGRMRSAEMATVEKGEKAGVDWRNVKLDMICHPLNRQITGDSILFLFEAFELFQRTLKASSTNQDFLFLL